MSSEFLTTVRHNAKLQGIFAATMISILLKFFSKKLYFVLEIAKI